EARLLRPFTVRREHHGLRDVDLVLTRAAAAATAAARKSSRRCTGRSIAIRLELHVAIADLVLRANALGEIHRCRSVERSVVEIEIRARDDPLPVRAVAVDAVARTRARVIV